MSIFLVSRFSMVKIKQYNLNYTVLLVFVKNYSLYLILSSNFLTSSGMFFGIFASIRIYKSQIFHSLILHFHLILNLVPPLVHSGIFNFRFSLYTVWISSLVHRIKSIIGTSNVFSTSSFGLTSCFFGSWAFCLP